MTETTELQKVEPKAELVAGNRVAPIVPRTIDEVFRVAHAIITAGLAPDSYSTGPNKVRLSDKETASRIMIGIMKGAEIGLAPITAINTIAIINGRPCLWGDGASALIQNSGQLEWQKRYYTGTENEDDWTAHVELKRAEQDEIYKGQFSVKDAKRAHLWGNPKRKPWIEYPQRQLMWRAFSWPARDGFSDVLSGLSIAEEARDLPAAPETVDKGFLEDAPPEQIEDMFEDAPTSPTETPTELTAKQRMVEASLRACVSVDSLEAFWASQEGVAEDDYLRGVYEGVRAELEAGQDPALFP